jgi:hypothetical protein
MNQTMAQTLFYGNTAVNPERFMGLAPRFSAISGADNAQNIIDAGGTGSDNTSVWLVVWGTNTVFGIYPKGSKAGLFHEDLGLIDAFDANNNRYRAYADRWQWKCGLHVKDWRYVVRICNIDVSDLVGITDHAGDHRRDAAHQADDPRDGAHPVHGQGHAGVLRQPHRQGDALHPRDGQVAERARVRAGINQFGAVSPGSVNNGDLTFQGVPIRTVDQITSPKRA